MAMKRQSKSCRLAATAICIASLLPILLFTQRNSYRGGLHESLSAAADTPLEPISLLFVIYHNLDYTWEVLEPFLPHISEIVVIDGPRKVSMELLQDMDMLYDEATSPVRHFFFKDFLPKYPHINLKYQFKIWDDELEQRNAGYDACSYPILVQADGDMLVQLDLATLNAFIADDRYAVASVDILNIYEPKQHLTLVRSPSDALPLSKYPCVGKRNKLSATEYFAHLWIVGTAQDAADEKLMFPAAIGFSYHLTLYASAPSMLIKYAFYRSAYYANLGDNGTAALSDYRIQYKRIKESFGVQGAQEVFVRENPTSGLCVPDSRSGRVFQRPHIYDLNLLRIMDKLSSRNICRHAIYHPEIPVVDSLASWMRLEGDLLHARSLKLDMNGFERCAIRILDLSLYSEQQERRIEITNDGPSSVFLLPPLPASLVFRAIGLTCFGDVYAARITLSIPSS